MSTLLTKMLNYFLWFFSDFSVFSFFIAKPQNTKNSLWMIGFQPIATSKATLWNNFSLSLSLFQVSMHLHQTNARNTHVAIFINTVYLSWIVNKRKLYWCWKKYLKLYPRSMALSFTVLIIILSAHYLSWKICRNKIYVIFTWVIKIISDC